MPLQKNQLLTLRIERLSSDGSGVAHSPEGEAVFVRVLPPGDEAQVAYRQGLRPVCLRHPGQTAHSFA